jgi:hypothetical protein
VLLGIADVEKDDTQHVAGYPAAEFRLGDAVRDFPVLFVEIGPWPAGQLTVACRDARAPAAGHHLTSPEDSHVFHVTLRKPSGCSHLPPIWT